MENFDLKHPTGNSVLTNSGKASCIYEGKEKQHSNEKHATEEQVSVAEEGQKRLEGITASTSMVKLLSFWNTKPYVEQPARKLLNCTALN